jgi:hypothetical protein
VPGVHRQALLAQTPGQLRATITSGVFWALFGYGFVGLALVMIVAILRM